MQTALRGDFLCAFAQALLGFQRFAGAETGQHLRLAAAGEEGGVMARHFVMLVLTHGQACGIQGAHALCSRAADSPARPK